MSGSLGILSSMPETCRPGHQHRTPAATAAGSKNYRIPLFPRRKFTKILVTATEATRQNAFAEHQFFCPRLRIDIKSWPE